MIGLKCPKCKAIMKLEESMAGNVATCPGCQGQFRVPPLPRRGPNPPPSTPAGKPNPSAKTGLAKQTAIQSKASKPPSDPSIRPARTSPISPVNARGSERLADARGSEGSPEDEEFEYSLEDIEDPEAPPPPPRKRPRIEVEEDHDEPTAEDDEENEDEDEYDEDEAADEDEDEDGDERPSAKKKKKKRSEGGSALPIVAGALILIVVARFTVGGYFLATGKGRGPDPAIAMAEIKKVGGQCIQDPNDPENPVIEVSLISTDANNGHLKLLRAFPKLKVLNLTRCTKIDNPGLEWLEDLKELRVLRLGFCSHVSDGGMEHIGKLTSLEELYLDQSNVTDGGLEELTGLKKLKKLGLSGCIFAHGRGLQASIPGLEVIQ